jgi:hypothetical protein
MHTHKHMHNNDQVYLYYCLAHALQVCYCLNGFSRTSRITVLLRILVITPNTVFNLILDIPMCYSNNYNKIISTSNTSMLFVVFLTVHHELTVY